MPCSEPSTSTRPDGFAYRGRNLEMAKGRFLNNTFGLLSPMRERSLKPNTLIQHPNGGYTFGTVPNTLPHGLPGGDIYLKMGVHRAPQNGFGAIHIWEAHKKDLEKLGYTQREDVIDYVASIIRPKTPIYCEFCSMRSTRLAVLKSPVGLLIIEHRPLQEAPLAYSVITAYPRRQAHGTLVGKIEKAP